MGHLPQCADNALSRIAAALGKKEDARLFHERSLGYKHYYCKEYGTFRPILPNGEFYAPFDPRQGENFEPNPGFHEGCAWNYTFYVPHDVKGLARLMGGKKPFVDKLQRVFDEGLYDPANAGTMSAWAIFNMMGFYPDCPGEPAYTLSTPVFDKVTIKLDPKYWGRDQLVIETERPSAESLYIREMELGGKKLSRYRITHEELVQSGKLRFRLR